MEHFRLRGESYGELARCLVDLLESHTRRPSLDGLVRLYLLLCTVDGEHPIYVGQCPAPDVLPPVQEALLLRSVQLSPISSLQKPGFESKRGSGFRLGEHL